MIGLDLIEARRRCAMETLIGIGVLLAGAGIGWLCFGLGVYFLTGAGRQGMRIARMGEAMELERMEKERRQRQAAEE
jgi:hypothetical protein